MRRRPGRPASRARRLAAPLAGALLLALACGAPPARQQEAPGQGEALQERAPGETPTADAPRRIVALAPNLTEILFGLGLGQRVAGVGDYSTWPPEAAGKPRLGGLFDPRLEAVTALDPDLAVLLPSEERTREQLEALGIEVLTVRSETLEDVEAAIQAIAGRCGVPETGRRVAAELRSALAPRPLAGRPRVALSLAREPGSLAEILVAGPGTYLDALLGRLGAVNAFADSALLYPQVGLEEILARQPEAVIELQPRAIGEERRRALAADWRAVPALAAAGAGCVRIVAGEHTLVPGLRLPRLYAELRRELAACGAGARSSG